VHRSRIGIVLIDHPVERHDAALAFWSVATGAEPVPAPGQPYASLGRLGSLNLEVQRTGTGTPPRLHLDIETDDIPAEVARLVAAGATVVDEPDGYVVLHDPGGLVFCVVGIQTGDRFAAEATTWP
jgi:catechol 2,3-dioxygenase-like lactoylglutathione lyase family enzyme